MRRMTGSVCSWGGRTKVSVVHARLRGCGEKHVMPHSAMVLVLREECVTFLTERTESRRASSVIRAGDVWSCAAS